MSNPDLPARLRYGGAADFAPYESLDAQGRPQGFQVAVLQALVQRLDCGLAIELAPWPQTQARFLAGEVDLVAMVPTAERRAWARFARGHAAPALTAYHRRGEPDPQGLQDLQGQRLVVLDSEPMRETLRTALAGLPPPVLSAESARAALQAVQDGDGDVAVLLRAYADPLLATGGLANVVPSRLNLGHQTYALAVLPANEAWLGPLQAALNALEAEGTLEALRLRWLPSHAALAQAHQLQAGLARQTLLTAEVAGAATLALGGLGWALHRRHRQAQAERAARLQVQQELARAEELLAQAFTNHPEAMLVIDRASASVLDANPAAHRLLGLPAGALPGQPLTALAQHLPAPVLDLLRATLDRDGEIQAAPLQLQRADGSPCETLVSVQEMLIGSEAQLFCLVRDISEQVRENADLRAGYDALLAEVRRSEDELGQARQAAFRAQQRLDDHTQAVSRTLQAPLRALHGLVGLLRLRVQAGQLREALAYTAHIERAGQRMDTLVSALARLAAAQRLPGPQQALDMTTLARNAWTTLALAYPQRRAQCRVDTLAAARGDPDLVAQVWVQLLDNAGKFSDQVPGPQVRVDSHEAADGTWWRVTDNGVGFDLSRAAGLFLPFRRLPSAAGFEGSGLGLATVRRIVEAHGGQVRIRSAPGVGTVVEFTLQPPAEPPAAR